MKSLTLVLLALVLVPATALDLRAEEAGGTVEERLDRLEKEVRELRLLVLELTAMLREDRAAKAAPPEPKVEPAPEPGNEDPVLLGYPERFFATHYHAAEIRPEQVTLFPRGEAVNRKHKYTEIWWDVQIDDLMRVQAMEFLAGVEKASPHVRALEVSLRGKRTRETGEDVWKGSFRLGYRRWGGEVRPVRSARVVLEKLDSALETQKEELGEFRISKLVVSQKRITLDGTIKNRGNVDLLAMILHKMDDLEVERDRTRVDPKTSRIAFGLEGIFKEP